MRLPRSLEKFFWINSLEELKSDKLAIIWRCIQTEIKCLVYYPFRNCNKVERRDAITTKGWWFLRWEIETPGAWSWSPAKSMVVPTRRKLNWICPTFSPRWFSAAWRIFLANEVVSDLQARSCTTTNKSQLCCQTDLKKVMFTKRRKDSSALILTKAVFLKSWDTYTRAVSKSLHLSDL